MKLVLHSKANSGEIRVWTVEVRGKYVVTEFGQLGGKMQTITDEGSYKNEGKANEVTPEEDALNMAARAILKKRREGYRDANEDLPEWIDWNAKCIPESTRFYKPDNTLSPTLAKKLDQGKARLTWKRDGEMMVAVKWADSSVTFLSRTMLWNHHLELGQFTWNDRLGHLVRELESDERIPPRSILLGDVVAHPEDRERWLVASVMKSKTEEAKKFLPLFYYCWDIAFWEGENVLETNTAGERIGLIDELFGEKESWVLPVMALTVCELRSLGPYASNMTPVQMANDYAKRNNWEGWVVVDPDKPIGPKSLNFRGKTYRPSGISGKLKPVYEDDFIAFFDPDGEYGEPCGKWGSGRYRGMVGSVTLGQYTEDGELVYICECGGGIDDAFREKFSDPAAYPIVIEVEYTERTYVSEGDKTNALTYPRVVRARPDKGMHECINKKL